MSLILRYAFLQGPQHLLLLLSDLFPSEVKQFHICFYSLKLPTDEYPSYFQVEFKHVRDFSETPHIVACSIVFFCIKDILMLLHGTVKICVLWDTFSGWSLLADTLVLLDYFFFKDFFRSTLYYGKINFQHFITLNYFCALALSNGIRFWGTIC